MMNLCVERNYVSKKRKKIERRISDALKEGNYDW